MARKEKAQGKDEMMGMDLHEMRQRGHEMGIEGASKMSEDQLRQAMKMMSKGKDPMMAKQEAKGNM